MVFQRAPRPNQAEQKKEVAILAPQNIRTILAVAEHDKSIHKQANLYDYKKLYELTGVDLEEEYKRRKISSRRTEIVDDFIHDRGHSLNAELAEKLPSFANTPGRLGDYLEANVTQTARPDDQGNCYIDLIVVVRNLLVTAKDAPSEFRNIPETMTFLVDMTAGNVEEVAKKQEILRDEYLVRGKKANVLCYKTSSGKLGTEQPKIIVSENAEYLEHTGSMLGGLIHQNASDSFSITNPEKFNEEYRAFFKQFMGAIRSNAKQNIAYMESLVPDPKRAELIKEYKGMVAFIDAYEKTPTTKKKN